MKNHKPTKYRQSKIKKLHFNNSFTKNLITDSTAKTKSLKPFFSFNNAYLYKGDVLNSSSFLKEFCDLIVTSPPYNVGIEYNSNNDVLTYDDYLKFTHKWLLNCYKWSKNSGRLLLNIPLDKNKGGQKSVGADITAIAQKVGWKYHSTIVWNEGNISRRTAWGSFMSASAPYVIAPVELILVLYKECWKKIDGSKISDISKKDFMDWTNGLWTFNGESKKRIGHPAPFPKELPYRVIKLFSYIGDIVFDPFSGSGTTALVAALNKRIGIGLDIDNQYCELAKRRILHELNTFNFQEAKNG
ncbi:MAG: site-specific DNA-methyltransferase [Elusimicrobiota bacterium]|jgi:site-specific DNA-methyltransferase (adenine-specific)|nr:site-specific DNA-methyltransferase [Elusimicrobiota bacterium]